MDHSPGFLNVVNEARPRVREITIDQAKAMLAANPQAVHDHPGARSELLGSLFLTQIVS